jgi:A/G-specific adenine glycosylase
MQVRVAELLTGIKHAYTHFRITLHAFRCHWLTGEPQPVGYAAVYWAAPASLPAYPFSVADLKIQRALDLR